MHLYPCLFGLINRLSRFLGEYMNDRFRFHIFRSIITLAIMMTFIATIFLYNLNFYGLAICLLLLYLLAFTQFASIPAQVNYIKTYIILYYFGFFQAIYLYNSSYNGALIGTLGNRRYGKDLKQKYFQV